MSNYKLKKNNNNNKNKNNKNNKNDNQQKLDCSCYEKIAKIFYDMTIELKINKKLDIFYLERYIFEHEKHTTLNDSILNNDDLCIFNKDLHSNNIKYILSHLDYDNLNNFGIMKIINLINFFELEDFFVEKYILHNLELNKNINIHVLNNTYKDKILRYIYRHTKYALSYEYIIEILLDKLDLFSNENSKEQILLYNYIENIMKTNHYDNNILRYFVLSLFNNYLNKDLNIISKFMSLIINNLSINEVNNVKKSKYFLNTFTKYNNYTKDLIIIILDILNMNNYELLIKDVIDNYKDRELDTILNNLSLLFKGHNFSIKVNSYEELKESINIYKNCSNILYNIIYDFINQKIIFDRLELMLLIANTVSLKLNNVDIFIHNLYNTYYMPISFKIIDILLKKNIYIHEIDFNNVIGNIVDNDENNNILEHDITIQDINNIILRYHEILISSYRYSYDYANVKRYNYSTFIDSNYEFINKYLTQDNKEKLVLSYVKNFSSNNYNRYYIDTNKILQLSKVTISLINKFKEYEKNTLFYINSLFQYIDYTSIDMTHDEFITFEEDANIIRNKQYVLQRINKVYNREVLPKINLSINTKNNYNQILNDMFPIIEEEAVIEKIEKKPKTRKTKKKEDITKLLELEKDFEEELNLLELESLKSKYIEPVETKKKTITKTKKKNKKIEEDDFYDEE